MRRPTTRVAATAPAAVVLTLVLVALTAGFVDGASAGAGRASSFGAASTPGATNSTTVIGVVATTAVGDLPSAIATDTSNGWVYVVNQGASDVTILEGSSVVGSVNVGVGAQGIVFDSGTGAMYVSNFRTNNVSVLEGTARIALLPVGSEPLSEVYDPANGFVYVLDYGSSSVTILSGTTVVANDTVGQGPVTGAYDASDGYVYVTAEYTKLEAVLSGTEVLDELFTGLVLPFDTVYDSFNGYLYVLNSTHQGGRYGAHVPVAIGVVLIGTRLAYSFESGTGPQFGAVAAVDPVNGWLYIPDAGTSSVTIVNGTDLVADVNIGSLPIDALFDPQSLEVYISDEQGYAVTVLNLTVIVAQPTVGIYPESMAYDPIDGSVYVANLGESTVSILGPVAGWEVQFVESGLPAGTTWSVTFAAVSHSSNTSTIEFYAPNGTYTFSVSPEVGYTLNNSTLAGVATVTESGATVPVVFTPDAGQKTSTEPVPWLNIYATLGVAALAAVLVTALVRRRVKGRRRRPTNLGP